MTANTPAPMSPPDDPEPPKPGSTLHQLFDRLPKEVGPVWYLLALLIIVLGVIGLAYVAGWVVATLGGGAGLVTLATTLRSKKP
ncbi:hypothetical protein [Amycolatopsis lexingtonensis]|uniref:hypothetical protein n=1 Tax=Amycolatopsis lexingtonensis TaxID=218822 RepID=UPI003F72784F